MDFLLEQIENPLYKSYSWVGYTKVTVSGGTSKRYRDYRGTESTVFSIECGAAYNCGTALWHKWRQVYCFDEAELEELYKYLQKRLTSDYMAERFSSFKHRQLFFIDKSTILGNPEYVNFVKVFKPQKVSTWQSASETGHTTSMFMIDF